MRKFIYLCCVSLLILGCDDGDVFEATLDFDKDLTFCNQSSTTYLIYDIRQNPFESLSLQFPRNSTTDLIFNPPENDYSYEFQINGTSTTFRYRIYDGNPANLLCTLVPAATPSIINDYSATAGTVNTLTTYIDDDLDGIPTDIEDKNLDGDNDPETDPTDFDEDGIPDYKDADDDNDNILTINENHNYSSTDGLVNAQNTDLDLPGGDTDPDYLDADDDADGVLTRFEDENADLNLFNDIDEASPNLNLARYLDPAADDSFQEDVEALAPNDYLPIIYQRRFNVKFEIRQVDLDILSTDFVDFGNLEYSITVEEE